MAGMMSGGSGDNNDGLSQDEDEEFDEAKGMDKISSNCAQTNGDEDAYRALRFVSLIGASVGLMPLAPKPEGHGRSSIFIRGRTLLSILSIILVGFNTVLIAIDFALYLSSTTKRNMGAIAGKLSGVWFYAAGLFVHAFLLMSSSRSARFFRMWTKVTKEVRGTAVEYRRLHFKLNLICIVVIGSCIGENMLYHVFSMRTGTLMKLTACMWALLISAAGGTITFWDFLVDYFRSNEYLHTFFSYNPILSFLFLVTNKLTLLAFNFGDVVLMFLCLMIHVRFKSLNQYLKQQMTAKPPSFIKQESVSWSLVRRNYFLIIKLLDEADRIFFPLIWASYATDTFFVCNQLYMNIRNTDLTTIADKMYLVWSLSHLAGRTLAVSIFAARVHEDSQELKYILQFCPAKEYNHDVRRLERFLSGRVIGITANGIFIVTRSFILMIISAIFTLEVVLLQNSATSN